MPFPLSCSDAPAELSHPVENVVHIRDNVMAAHNDGCPPRRAQCDMQRRPVFGAVDRVAPEHGVDPLPQARFLCKLEKEFERSAGNTVLGIVEIYAGSLCSQAFSTLGVGVKQLPEASHAHSGKMSFEFFPGCEFCKRGMGKRFYRFFAVHDLESFEKVISYFAASRVRRQAGFCIPPFSR
jgi:hypothetical protein